MSSAISATGLSVARRAISSALGIGMCASSGIAALRGAGCPDFAAMVHGP
jgi:hypothetical protein